MRKDLFSLEQVACALGTKKWKLIRSLIRRGYITLSLAVTSEGFKEGIVTEIHVPMIEEGVEFTETYLRITPAGFLMFIEEVYYGSV